MLDEQVGARRESFRGKGNLVAAASIVRLLVEEVCGEGEFEGLGIGRGKWMGMDAWKGVAWLERYVANEDEPNLGLFDGVLLEKAVGSIRRCTREWVTKCWDALWLVGGRWVDTVCEVGVLLDPRLRSTVMSVYRDFHVYCGRKRFMKLLRFEFDIPEQVSK